MAERTLAIRISEEMYKKIKLRLAETGLTLKDYMIQLIENELNRRDGAPVFDKKVIIDHAEEIATLLNKYADK